MGRIYETRKYVMFARFARMSKAFNRIGRDINVAVKVGGPDPKGNPRLRIAIQNAKSVNMPKDRVEAAIKRASDKDTTGYEEIIYEGYAPHGIGLVIECTSDNPTRTVANVRHYLTKVRAQRRSPCHSQLLPLADRPGRALRAPIRCRSMAMAGSSR